MATYDIRDYGAVGDGKTNDAAAIQVAIDACASSGGGTVLIPAGHVFLAGTIQLRSYVELHVERGAVLQASGDWDDYTDRFVVSALSSGVVRDDTQASGMFISARDAHHIAITGAGVIDGAGRHFIEKDLGPIYQCPNARPFTMFLIGCTDVTLRDTTWRDGALWTLRLTGCEDIVIHGIRIDGDLKYPNCDGIDLDRCRNARISDCYISCGDDAISLKTCEEFPEHGPCENITVTNCVLVTTSSALVVGVDAIAPIRNVVFDNCVIQRSHRGLSVNCGQDSLFENILFSNIVVETRIFDDKWWGRGEPIYVSVEPWHNDVGRIRNVRFVNILARSENGAYISGIQDGVIDGVLLDNVRIELDKWSNQPGGRYDRRPSSGADPIFEAPTSGFYIDRASNVTLRNCEVVWGDNRPEYFHHALASSNTENLKVENFIGASAHPDRHAAVATF
ncbi:glycoside hydrolase family 28 protein [Mangrovihabitans endophyticus]|uniref:Endopolygalacturonase n=1 Tax=Mangrovihabitans endophyticus TaxID=1751298 RepID=A0A8J3BW13_9ACTN|nr:glycosyl hydrolase family 28 protein [Mangrovihabitans endophyticus]GGK78482.1 endopolygalacturonase [Mangrovihabitans endophyticus]